MRKLALLIIPALAFGAADAHAAKAPKALQQAAERSFAGLKAHDSKNGPAYVGDRLLVNAIGKRGYAQIQAFGRPPGPPRVVPVQNSWHTIKTADFAKNAEGKWVKQGKWNTLMFALAAGK